MTTLTKSVKLKATVHIEVEYEANPYAYGTTDIEEMAEIDLTNFKEDLWALIQVAEENDGIIKLEVMPAQKD